MGFKKKIRVRNYFVERNKIEEKSSSKYKCPSKGEDL